MPVPAPATAATGAPPRAAIRQLHLLTLTALAVAQPLLDLLGRTPTFFAVRGTGGGELVLLALALAILPALPLMVVVAIAERVGRRTGAVVYAAALAALLVLLTLQTLRRALDGWAWLVAGVVVGLLLAVAYRRFAALRQFVTVLALALVVIPAVFLLRPGIRKLLAGDADALPRHASGATTPIFFLVFDELPLFALLDADGGIDRVSYPNLAELADRATFFDHALTVSDVTDLAVPAILTGRFPEPDRLPTAADYPHSLFTLFGDYRIWAHESVTQMCPPERNRAAFLAPDPGWRALAADLAVVYAHLVAAPRFAVALPSVTLGWSGFGDGGAPATATRPVAASPPAGRATLAGSVDFIYQARGALLEDRATLFRRWLDAFSAEDDRALYFLHLLLPHYPWEYLPSGKRYPARSDRIPGTERGIWIDDEAARVSYQRFLLQVQFLDRLIGEMIARLRALELFDRALIVIVADHGVSFEPGGHRRLLQQGRDVDLVPVPLLIKSPGQQRGEMVSRRMPLIDVLPTVLDILGIESPWPLDGLPASAPPRPAGKIRIRTKQGLIEQERDPRAAVDERVARRLARFGRGAEVFAAGDPAWLGRAVSEIGWRQAGPGLEVRLEAAGLLRDVDPRSGWVPAVIRGRIEGAADDPACCQLAVAVNGVVRATTRTLRREPDAGFFEVVVAESALEPGDNRVEIFRLVDEPGGRVPLRLATRDDAYTLVKDGAGRIRAVTWGEESYPLVADRPGYLIGTHERGERVIVNGWAVDGDGPPAAIVIFLGDEPVWAGATNGPAPGAAKLRGLPPATRIGFQVQLPRRRLPDLEHEGLRVLALTAAGTAGELGYFHHFERSPGVAAGELKAGNGARMPVAPGAVDGAVETFERDGDRLRIDGWTADLDRREAVSKVLVFGGTRQLITRFTRLRPRPELAARHGLPADLPIAFEIEITLPPDRAAEPIAVVGLSRQRRGSILGGGVPTASEAQKKRSGPSSTSTTDSS